jgi:hypothetical protein
VSHPRRHKSSHTRWINTLTCNCNFSDIEKTVEKDKDVPVENLSTLARIQRIQHTMLVWMFAQAVNDYNEVLLKHQDKCRAMLRQQMMISKFSGSQNGGDGSILMCTCGGQYGAACWVLHTECRVYPNIKGPPFIKDNHPFTYTVLIFRKCQYRKVQLSMC